MSELKAAPGFEVVCPGGWQRVDPQRVDRHRIESMCAHFARRAPVALRPALTSRLATALVHNLAAMAQGGAVLALIAGPAAPASIWQPIVSLAPFAWPDGTEPMPSLMALAAHDPTAEVFDLQEAVSLRTWTRSSVTAEAAHEAAGTLGLDDLPTPAGGTSLDDVQLGRYVVRYRIGLPDDPQMWVEALCTGTVGLFDDAQSSHESLIEVFDAVLSTFRWVD